MSGLGRRQVLGAGLAGALLIGTRAFAVEQADIEDFIGVALPEGAENLRMAEEAGIDRMVRLRFDAPTAAAEQFAAAVVPAALIPNGAPLLAGYGGDLDWWFSEHESGLRSAAAQAETENLAVMLAQKTLDAASTRTWLMAFTV